MQRPTEGSYGVMDLMFEEPLYLDQLPGSVGT